MVLLDDLLAKQQSLGAISDQELLDAFKDSPRDVLKKVGWSEPSNPNRQRLARLIGKAGREATLTLTRILNQNPSLRPIAQPETGPQPQPEATGAEIPEISPEDILKQQAEEIREPLYDQEKAKHLEGIIKQLSKSYFDYYADVATHRTATTPAGFISPEEASRLAASSGAQIAGQHLTNWLIQARGDFEPYLKGATGEMIKNFLGPIGDAWRVLESAGAKLQQPQAISPLLDPYLVDRAVKKLEHQSFEVIRAPFRATFAILANMGLPGVKILYSSAPVYNEHTEKIEYQPITRVVPTIFHKLFSFTEKTADGIDHWTKTPTGHLLEHAYQHQFLEDLNHAINIHDQRQKTYALDKSGRNKLALLSASRNLHRLMDRYDGRETIKYKKGKILNQLGDDTKNFFRGLTRKSLIGIAKNLRRTDRDPLTYIGALVGSLAWEVIAGATINPLTYVFSRILRLVPGYNVARAYITNSILNSPGATSGRIFGTNFKSLVKGTLSLNTLASSYLGFQLGQTLIPNSPFGLATGTIAGGLGAFYTTGLTNIIQGAPLIDLVSGATVSMPGLGAMPTQVQWYFEQTASGPIYRRAFWGLGAQQPVYLPSSEIGIQTNLKYFESPAWQKVFGVTPGGWNAPISKFSAWLWRHPYTRLPIKGFALRSLLLNLLPAEVLSLNVAGIPVSTIVNALPFIDYFWQVKRVLGFDILSSLAKSPAGQWVGNRIYAPIQSRFINLLYDPNIVTPEGTGFRTLTRWFNSLSPINPGLQARPWLQFARNIINPGLFMGLGLIPAFLASGNVVMAIASPLAFSTAWTLYGNFLVKLTNASAGRTITLAHVNPWGWIGTLIATFTQGFVPINPFLYQAILGFGLPFIMTLFPKLLGSFGAWLGRLGLSALSGLITGFSSGLVAVNVAIEAGIAGFGALIPILSTAAVVLTAGYFVFVVVSAFYIPFSDASATNVSSSFNLSVPTNLTLAVGEAKTVCPTFSIKQNPLLLKDPYIYFTAQYNLTVWDNIGDYQVRRLLPSSWRPNDRTLPPSGWHKLEEWPSGGHPIANNIFTYTVNYPLSPSLLNLAIDIGAFGKDNTDQTHQRGKTAFELKNEFSSINSVVNTYLDYIAATETQAGKDRLLENIQSKIDMLKFNQNQSTNYNDQLQEVAEMIVVENQSVSVKLNSLLNETTTRLNPSHPDYVVPPEIQGYLQQALNKQDNCGEDNACYTHYQQLINSYSSWPKIFKDLADILRKLVNAAELAEAANPQNPDYAQLTILVQAAIGLLDENATGFEAQVNELNDIAGKIRNIPVGIDLDVLSPEDIQGILQRIFGDIFNPSFYYLPGDAQFEVCITAIFQPDPSIYDLNNSEDLAKAYQDAAIKIEVAGNQAYLGPLSQASGIASGTITFTH